MLGRLRVFDSESYRSSANPQFDFSMTGNRYRAASHSGLEPPEGQLGYFQPCRREPVWHGTRSLRPARIVGGDAMLGTIVVRRSKNPSWFGVGAAQSLARLYLPDPIITLRSALRLLAVASFPGPL